ncbi:MAG: dTMP kinase [Chloroflexota bacterium]
MTDGGNAMLPGWFLTVEGPDGAGKTSQVERLRDRATEAGFDVLVTREPGGTAAGERIREVLLRSGADAPLDPRTDALLFNAARAQLVAEVIKPALARGRLVVSTRFADSTLAYQGYGAGLPLDELRAIESVATGGLRPDLTILLDVPVAVGLARKSGVEVTRFESEFDVAFHQRVRDGFRALAAAEPDRFAVVDATLPEEDVAAAVVAAAARVPRLERLSAAAPSEPAPLAGRIQR